MTTAKKPLARFKVFPGKGNEMAKERRCFWDVRVYKTRGAMVRAYKELSPEDKDEDFAAIVMPVEAHRLQGKKWIVQPILGFVLFYKGSCGAEVIAHESNHMSINYLRRVNPKAIKLKMDGDDDTEEHMCYATGACARQITRACYRFGVYE